jgi:hypothetical protein
MNDIYDNNQAGKLGYLNMTRVQGVARFLRENSAFYRWMRERVLSVEAQMALRDPCAGGDATFCWETTRQLLDQMEDHPHSQVRAVVFPIARRRLRVTNIEAPIASDGRCPRQRHPGVDLLRRSRNRTMSYSWTTIPDKWASIATIECSISWILVCCRRRPKWKRDRFISSCALRFVRGM